MTSMELGDDIEVTTDDRTVWVNGPTHNLGRFCPISYEVFGSTEEDPEFWTPLSVRIIHVRQMSAWNNFVALMKSRHGVEIPFSYRPSWVQPDKILKTVRF